MFSKYGFLRSYLRRRRSLRRYKISSPDIALMDAGKSSVLDYFDWEQIGGMAAPEIGGVGVDSFVWFVPNWSNVWGGGHYTLFRFADHYARKGIKQYIFVYDNKGHADVLRLQSELDTVFSKGSMEVIGEIAKVPACNVALATTWQSAYYVRSFNHCEHKFYFMQDFESHFYAHGTASMQANNTYTFGFHGITGGDWNRQQFLSFGGFAEAYIASTDRNIFFPANEGGQVREAVSRIFFYGRPSTERRCFELGIEVLYLISLKYPDIELVIAGLDMKQAPSFKCTMLGNLTLAKTGELYRSCDIGIAFSGTNLSYLPGELMACGVPVISNNGPHVEWYCRHGENSLLVDPTPRSVLAAVTSLVEDKVLRQRLAVGGIERAGLTTWEGEMDKIFSYISDIRETAVANNSIVSSR